MFWKIILSRHTKNLRDHGGSSKISHKSFLSGIVWHAMDESIFEEKNNLTVASFCVKYVCHVSFRRTLKGTCTILILCSHCRVLVASILVLINTFWECLRWIIELHDTVINADFAFRDRWHYQIGWIFGKITKVWNFSENSFDLVAPSVPYHLDNSLVSQNGQFGPDRTVLLLRVIRMVRVIWMRLRQ